MMETLVIDVIEQINVAIFDVPGDLYKPRYQQILFLPMLIRDEFLDIMCEVNPEKYHMWDIKMVKRHCT